MYITNTAVSGVQSDKTVDWAELPIMPNSYYSHCIGIAIGTDIYLRLNQSTSSFYKYDTLTNTYIKLSDFPSTCTDGNRLGGFAYYNGYIYHGGNNSSLYQYDVSNDTWTTVIDNVNMSWSHCRKCFQIGKKMYFANVYGAGNQLHYIDLSDFTVGTCADLLSDDGNTEFCEPGYTVVGTDCYYRRPYNYPYRLCKYDSLTNTHEAIAIPSVISGKTISGYDSNGGCSICTDGNSIYILGGFYYVGDTATGSINQDTYQRWKRVIKYDIDTKEFSLVDDLLLNYPMQRGCCPILCGGKIYIFGDGWSTSSSDINTMNKLQVLSMVDKTIEDKTFVLVQGAFPPSNDKSTELFTNIAFSNNPKVHFNNAYYATTSGGLNRDLSKYIGNGSEWIEFK